MLDLKRSLRLGCCVFVVGAMCALPLSISFGQSGGCVGDKAGSDKPVGTFRFVAVASDLVVPTQGSRRVGPATFMPTVHSCPHSHCGLHDAGDKYTLTGPDPGGAFLINVRVECKGIPPADDKVCDLDTYERPPATQRFYQAPQIDFYQRSEQVSAQIVGEAATMGETAPREEQISSGSIIEGQEFDTKITFSTHPGTSIQLYSGTRLYLDTLFGHVVVDPEHPRPPWLHFLGNSSREVGRAPIEGHPGLGIQIMEVNSRYEVEDPSCIAFHEASPFVTNYDGNGHPLSFTLAEDMSGTLLQQWTLLPNNSGYTEISNTGGRRTLLFAGRGIFVHCSGSILRMSGVSNYRLFLPDKGCNFMWIWGNSTRDNTSWGKIGEMTNVRWP